MSTSWEDQRAAIMAQADEYRALCANVKAYGPDAARSQRALLEWVEPLRAESERHDDALVYALTGFEHSRLRALKLGMDALERVGVTYRTDDAGNSHWSAQVSIW